MKKIVILLIFFCVSISCIQAQWAKQVTHTGASIWETKFLTPDIGYAIGWVNSTSTFLKTHDGGKTWAKTDMPNTYMFSVQFLDSLSGYIAGYDFGCSCGYIRKTTDGGNNWTDTRLSETFGLYRIKMKDMNNGWVSGYQGRILSTSNGWASHDSGQTGTGSIVFREFTAPNQDTLYAGGGPDFATQNVVYRSTDKGKTWTKIQDYGTNFSIVSLYFLNGKTGFMAGSNGVDAILKTTDAGQTWAPKYAGKNSADLVTDVSFSGGMGYAVTSSGKILKSFDKGESWVSELSPVTNSLYSIQMVNDNTGYAAGEAGIMIKRSSNSGVFEQEQTEDRFNVRVYPNPFSNQANITFEMDKTGKADIDLYDIEGRLVKNVFSKNVEIGSQKIEFNKNTLKEGVYYLQFKTMNDFVVKKIIIE